MDNRTKQELLGKIYDLNALLQQEITEHDFIIDLANAAIRDLNYIVVAASSPDFDKEIEEN